MYTKFHTKTLVTQFIQQLLADSTFPIEKTVSIGDYVVKGITYITSTFIVKAIKSGQYTSTNFGEMFAIQGPYSYGSKYSGLTCNYISNKSSYDSLSHYYLGQYLRAYRDLKQVNLLPFYNCFGDEYIDYISFTGTSVVSYPDTRYKFITVPIKFGKQYSIAMDFFGSIDIRCAFIGGKGLLSSDTAKLISIFKNTANKQVYSQMSKPFLFNGVLLESILNNITQENEKLLAQLLSKERFLRLIIRIPKNCDSSIAVLEGNYTKLNEVFIKNPVPYHVIFGNLSHSDTSGEVAIELNNQLISQLSLLKMSDGFSYPFADRLIEYLLEAVITSQETIDNNILRVQETISSYKHERINNTRYSADFVPGVWDNNMRNYLYNLAIKSDYLNYKYDLTGFVDKDIEQLINRGV